MIQDRALGQRTMTLGVLLELIKPRVNAMVVLTTLVGALIAARGSAVPVTPLLAALVGTFLLASAAAVLNMVLEVESDQLMERTAQRPLPSGRAEPAQAFWLGIVLALAGTTLLVVRTNPLTTLLGVLSLAAYLLVYTPLKRVTPWSTHIGAIPGALPAMMGWTALQSSPGLAGFRPDSLPAELGRLGIEAWILFGILFFWQLPHFFAIAWRYRDDYVRGGLAMLSVRDPDGSRCAVQSLVFTVALVLVTLLAWSAGLGGGLYLSAALLLGTLFLAAALAFALERNQARARALMLYSIVYLPLLLLILVLDPPA